MSWQTVAHVLDKAIATVAEQEFNRLAGGLNNDQIVAEKVTETLESLRGLQRGYEPEYNEWEALFYLTWYQPRQINAALTILRQLYADARNERPRTEYPLYIIDVGCGALAVQIATAIVATEYQREDIDVSVQGIDPSEPMKKIGENLWLEFWYIVDQYPDLSYLSSACDMMTTTCDLFDSHTSYYRSEDAFLQYYPDCECWLMAVHTVYESNKQFMKDTLQTIRDKSGPDVILVTSHASKRDIASFVVGENFQSCVLRSNALLLSGNLPETTEWRRRLIDRLLLRACGDIVQPFLNQRVEWNPLNNRTAVLWRGD